MSLDRDPVKVGIRREPPLTTAAMTSHAPGEKDRPASIRHPVGQPGKGWGFRSRLLDPGQRPRRRGPAQFEGQQPPIVLIAVGGDLRRIDRRHRAAEPGQDRDVLLALDFIADRRRHHRGPDVDVGQLSSTVRPVHSEMPGRRPLDHQIPGRGQNPASGPIGVAHRNPPPLLLGNRVVGNQNLFGQWRGMPGRRRHDLFEHGPLSRAHQIQDETEHRD